MQNLVSKNPILRFKLGKKLFYFSGGGRYRVVDRISGEERRFSTREEAKKYQMSTKAQGTRVLYDDIKEASGSPLKVDRTKEKSTEYGRLKLEKYNNLSFKQAYQAARNSGNKYFAYKGKVYKSDLENGKDNMTEMMLHYGNNLGFTGNPKIGTKKSMQARAQYRKDINTSEVGYSGERVKTKVPYVSSYDGGELFSNFMGLASPTRWVGAISRASRGEGNTGTFVGKVLNNMLDPLNGARENQGIFSLGLAPSDEQWAAEHPVISGVTNGILDAAVYGPKPKFTKEFKTRPVYGNIGRTYGPKPLPIEVPMNIYEGDLNISPGISLGNRPYIDLGKKVGETTKIVTPKRPIINRGKSYIKYYKDVPTGNYNFSWSEGMKDMFPWITATTNNNIMKEEK